MELHPAELEIPQRYKLLIGSIIPRPIALVSTVDGAGRANVAPFSFFAGVGSNPMSLLLCPAHKPDGSEKDTLRNCAPRSEGGTGEFVVHIAHERQIRRVAASAEALPFGESEFALAGFQAVAWPEVGPPRVEGCPVAFACRTTGIVRTNPGAPAGGNVVLGEVFRVFVAEGVVDEALRVDPRAIAPVSRLGGLGYARLGEAFELPVGEAALSARVPFETA
ncbi:MAG: flavin reductase family protein [Phycisphaerales bacterium]|nr:flavin reductase family protein [Phycisphaerales bacterium]